MKVFAVCLVAACVVLAVPGWADEGCADPSRCGNATKCDQCGCHAACQKKTCQVVCEMKKEKKYTWRVECTEFCPLLPGCKDRCRDPGCEDPGQGCGGKCCEGCASKCGSRCAGKCCDPCKTRCPPPPRCGHTKCVKKLVKKEYEVEVPVYKCVVKHLCDGCCKAEPAPAPPATKAKAAAAPSLPPAPPVPGPNADRSASRLTIQLPRL